VDVTIEVLDLMVVLVLFTAELEVTFEVVLLVFGVDEVLGVVDVVEVVLTTGPVPQVEPISPYLMFE